MNRLQEWLRRVWYLINRRRIDTALEAEMEAHRSEMVRPARFGNVLRLREEAGDVWGWGWLDDLSRDLRLGLRTLRRSPGFTMSATLILSLGIGINLAFFQFVNAALLQPLRVKDPQTLVYFHYRAPTFDSSEVPYPVAMFVREHSGALSAVLVSRTGAVTWGEAGAERASGEFVSSNWFDELGAAASAGRVLHAGTDGSPSAPPVVVLSQGFWQRQLGGRVDIVGSLLRINGRPALVVGVVDPGFPGLRLTSPQLWMPIEQVGYFQPGNRLDTDWATQSIDMYGRLRPGVSSAAAKTSLSATIDALSAIHPEAVTRGQWLEPYSANVRFMAPRERQKQWAIVAASATLMALVLMIACLNLSNLTLARAISRLREMSIRTALGAGRWRVVRHLLVENGLLACAGAIGGLMLGLGAASIVASVTRLPSALGLTPDWRTGLAATVAALFSTLALGIAPAWKIGRQDLTLATRDGGERASQGLHAARLRHWLVAGQIAGSCVLLVFAGQMVRGLQRLVDTDQGFSFDQVAVLEPPLGGFGVTSSAVPSYWEHVRGIVGAYPETEQMTLVTSVPLGAGMPTWRYKVAEHISFRVTNVDPNFFSTLEIPILAGRTFLRGDDAQQAVIISRRAAMEMYGTIDVLGQVFPKGKGTARIVGIAGDAQLSNVQATDMAELYWPLQPGKANAMLVRARTEAARLLSPLRDAARAADPRVIPEVRLMRDDFEHALDVPRLTSAIAGSAALAAVALAAVGIFGIVSYGAGLRTKEVGIRLALGARAGSIVRILLRHTIWSVTTGAAVGLAGGWSASRAFAGEPFYLQPLDFAAYLTAGVALLFVASVAALLPAWRTLRVDPLGALRRE